MSTRNSSQHKCLLTTHEAVNFSPSKATHSFSKDTRFKSISGHKHEHSEFTHNLPSTFGRRSPSFGVGDRFKVRIPNLPDPGAYKALSSFQTENRTALPKTNYYTFDKSATREQMNRMYNPLDNSPRGEEAKQVPGPGQYQYKNMSVGTGGRHYSFLKKTKCAQDPEHVMIKQQVPGAGTYAPTIAMNKFGKYVLSTVPNSRAANWSPSKNRFLDQSRRSRDQPGPGAYNPSDMDSNAGSYITSNFRNTGNVKFIKPQTLHGGATLRSRTPMINRAATMTPGPGSYMLPSDFGNLRQDRGDDNNSRKGSPRNMMSTQGSERPRLISRLQLSTMTDQKNHKFEPFSATVPTSGNRMTGGTIVKSQNVKKRNQRERMNSTFMRMRTVDMTDPTDLKQDSIADQNPVTTRE